MIYTAKQKEGVEDFTLPLPKTQKRLKEVLKTYKLTHEAFAKVVGLDAPYISRFSRCSFNAYPAKWIINRLLSGLFNEECVEFKEVQEELYLVCGIITGSKKLFDWDSGERITFVLHKFNKKLTTKGGKPKMKTSTKSSKYEQTIAKKRYVMTKKCTKCGQLHTLANFSKDVQKRDGYSCQCKTCDRKANNAKRRDRLAQPIISDCVLNDTTIPKKFSALEKAALLWKLITR